MPFGTECDLVVKAPFWRRTFFRRRVSPEPASLSPSGFRSIPRETREPSADATLPAATVLPPLLERLLSHAEADYRDALRLLLLQMVDLHKLYLEDPGNYLALQHSAVAAVRRFPGMEGEGLAERLIYALEQHVRGNLVHSEVSSEMAKWFCTLVNGEDLPHERVRFPAGSTLIRQGERGTQAYLIHSGQVRVLTCDADGRRRERAVLKPVALVGEFRLLYDTPASASVVAVDNVEAFEIDRAEIRRVLQRNTGLRYWIIQEANQRLRPLVEERLGKAMVDGWLAGMARNEVLAQFKDELLASLFMMLHACAESQPPAGVAALANIANIYNKILNSAHAPIVHTFRAGMPELATLGNQSLDLICVFDGAEAVLPAAAAGRIPEVLRYKGACYVLGEDLGLVLPRMRQTGLTHFALGRHLHAFVKTSPAALPARPTAPGDGGGSPARRAILPAA